MQAQLQSEGVDVNGVTNIIEEMSKRNRELFKLPPYVLYVSRAFSTLEGIGLSINDDYSILQECYPYLSKR
jgi:predicted unusual protein kinase regulating ubiquinone biosynthesis (AarF/ABC1/UbiB family)